MHQYTHDHTKRWAEIVDNLDAFIFVTPKYNPSFPAVLKNALDFLAIKWRDKAAAIVNYGGVDAGTRSAAQLQQLLHIPGIKATRSAVNIPFHFSRDFSEGFPASEPEKKALDGALDEIASWEEILRPLRQK